MPKGSVPAVHFEVILSDGSVHYEKNSLTAWSQFRDYCLANNLTINKMTVFAQDGEDRVIQRNNACFFFMFYDVAASLQKGTQFMKKCYGVTARHPGNVVKTYLTWFDDNGHFLHSEVMRGALDFHEKEIGIQASQV